jgi:hypothetical protein
MARQLSYLPEGTEGLNPAPSSSESGTNRAAAGDLRAPMNDALQQQLVRTVENSHHGATYPVGRLPEICVTSSMHLSSTAISCSRLNAIGFSCD